MANYLLPERYLLGVGFLFILMVLPVGLLCKKSRQRKCLALALCALSAGLLWTAAYTRVFYQPAQLMDDRTVWMTGEVADWPRETEYGYSVLIRAKTDGFAVIPTLLYVDEQGADLRPGDKLRTIVHCTLAQRSAAGEEITYYTAKGIFLWGQTYGQLEYERPDRIPLRYWPVVLSDRLKQGIENSFPPDAAPLIRALVTGNRDALTDPFTSSLQRTGLSHTVAVSGMHVAFLAELLSTLLGKGRRRTALVMIPSVLLFMVVAGNTPSVVRASVMILLLQIAPLLGRERDDPTALGFALMLILAQNPFAAAHVGLQLSFLSVAGILLFSDRMRKWLLNKLGLKRQKAWSLRWMGNKAVYFCVSTFSATVGAMALTIPLVALYFQTFSLIAPLANLLTLWAVSLAFMGGLVTGVVGAVSPLAGGILGLVVTPLARYLNWMVPLLAKAPFAAVTMHSFYYQAWMGFAYLLFLLTAVKRGRRRLLLPAVASAVALAASVFFTMYSFWSSPMAVSVLDVGQGQSILLRVGNSLALVDCGGDCREGAGEVAADYIRDLGRDEVDLLVISHFHDDHAGGVPQLLERIEVETIVLPEWEEDSSLYREIITAARKQDIELRVISADETLNWGDGLLTIFPPLGEKTANERGLTVLARAGTFDVLITGDMGEDIEKELLAHAQLPDIEVLVAGHHGAGDSTGQALLDAVRPELAVISAGSGNRYGHPHWETLERLTAVGAEIYRTDLHGTVRIKPNIGNQ